MRSDISGPAKSEFPPTTSKYSFSPLAVTGLLFELVVADAPPVEMLF